MSIVIFRKTLKEWLKKVNSQDNIGEKWNNKKKQKKARNKRK